MRLSSSGLVAASIFLATSSLAAGDPQFALDRFEPSERGSEWLANESLDLRGQWRPSFGYVLSYARRSYVVHAPTEVAPVQDLMLLHLGGSVVAFDRLRLALDLPLEPYADGQSAPGIAAPANGEGIGDLRVGADVKLFGEHGESITGAAGMQVWAPTGQRSQWTSDGVFRARPRMMLAGELGAFVWASQLGVEFRRRSEVTFAASAGMRVSETLVVGPELFASAVAGEASSKQNTVVEAMLGAHWLVQRTARVSGSVGAGLSDGVGAPAFRAIFAIEWVPGLKASTPPAPGPEADPAARAAIAAQRARDRDRDRDGVRDAVDACPDVLGVATADPTTNGCPPDADGDGIDDVSDACPTVPGIATAEPAYRGCPDRDADKDGIAVPEDACPDDRGPPDVDPRRNGCPPAIVRESRIDTFDRIAFKDGSAELEPAAAKANESLLTAILGVILKLPETTKVRIEGHTEDRGDPAAGRRLGLGRASLVSRWLVEHGIDPARLAAVGVGPDRPIATNQTEAGRKTNRRLELHLEPEVQ
jgi:outer membrane protein OmpA-like peptidoglycan-associated protein